MGRPRDRYCEAGNQRQQQFQLLINSCVVLEFVFPPTDSGNLTFPHYWYMFCRAVTLKMALVAENRMSFLCRCAACRWLMTSGCIRASLVKRWIEEAIACARVFQGVQGNKGHRCDLLCNDGKLFSSRYIDTDTAIS